ncbi:MAG: GtrA family protein [Lachnospiraceae bacterium]|nr:GtrA family protein [Lachnospiraceae bacterium]
MSKKNHIEKKDIFDKIMSLPGLCILEPFYKKNKEVLLYLFFGVLSFIVSIASYAYFNIVLDMNELIANIFSWILAVIFAFVTNKIWVFRSKNASFLEFLREMFSFFTGRLATLGVEEVILLIFITGLSFNSMAVKVVAQIVVILLNYVISKLFVFKENK